MSGGEGRTNPRINFGYYRDPNGKNIKKHGKVAAGVLNGTYWDTHTYPKNKNSLYLSASNVSVIQDDFREAQMSVFMQANISEALHFKRD